MDYSSLYDLITYLEYGTKLHIGVLFFGHYGNEKLALPHTQTIHSSPVCDEMKSRPGGYGKCFRCRNTAIKKAMDTKKPFGGFCINGIYEYTRPVILDDEVACIIFIGNILNKEHGYERLKFRLSQKEDIFETLESDFSPEKCEALGSLTESYIRMVLSMPDSKNAKDGFNPLIENLKKYIETNLEYDIKISHIARIFHYNEKYLGRLFRSETGMSFKEYINNARVERAKILLRETDDKIIDISSAVGYNNVTYFNRVFKKYFSVSPDGYRRRICK